MTQRFQFGDAYIQAQEEKCPAVEDGEAAKAILPHPQRAQVAYVSANINHLYGDSMAEEGISIEIAKGDQVAVLTASDGWVKIRHGAHTGWLDSSLLQSAAPASTMFVFRSRCSRSARGQKVAPPRNGTAVSAGSSIDGWSIVSVRGLSQEMDTYKCATHFQNPCDGSEKGYR